MLSQREQEVLTLYVQGFLCKEIAARLGISESTVRQHIRNIVIKTAANSMRHAAWLRSKAA